jgi:predicted permease
MKLLRQLRALFRKEKLDAEMAEEIRAHLELQAAENERRGLSAAEARYAAQRSFGGVEQIKERARDERGWMWIDHFWQDLRYAVRALRKTPSFTITAILTLALGIGVNAALFSVFDMVALRPLPVKEPDNLVRLVGRDARGNRNRWFSHAEYLAYREGSRTLDGLLAVNDETRVSFQREAGAAPDLNFESGGPGTVPIELVSENYFGVLGGALQLGRAFLPEEVTTGAAPVIVLSHLFWERYFNRDPKVIGTTFKLGRRMVTVIGVATAEFSGQAPVPPAGWLPLQAWHNRPADYGPNGPSMFLLIGRLKPGVNAAQAKAELDAVASRRAAEFPGANAKLSVRLERGLHFMNFTRSPQSLAALGTLFLGFGLVLVIACTNVANLLLARGVSRQPEIGVRLTLGASRGRIVRQLLTENVLLCGLGAVLGLGLATWTLQLLLPIIVARLPVDWALETRRLPFFDPTPDLRVLGFTVLLTAGATLVAGLLPAWHAAGANLIATMQNQGTAFGRRIAPSRLRQFLVISQVAVCLMLLSCAGVLARNFFTLRQVDPGFDAHAVFRVLLTPNAAITDRNIAIRQALETVRAIPGVAACGVVNGAPLLGPAAHPRVRPVEAAAGGTDEEVSASFVTGGFFDTFGIPLLRGRVFRELEQHAASRAIIVSESLARRLWPGQAAVGQTLAVSEAPWGSRERPAPAGAFRECEVIGVARDVMLRMGETDRRLLYLPLALEVPAPWPVFIRPRSDSAAALAEIVRAAEAGGIGLQFDRRHSYWLEQLVLPFYGLAILSGALGVLALGMASVGLYGLMAFSVNQRVREIGIRMALGATAEKVVALFVRQGMRLVTIGLALGLVGGGLFALVLRTLFFGLVDAFDPAAFGGVTLLFALLALFACWLPARRAAKVDPMVALRCE